MARTEGERLFEEYLTTQGMTNFEYEKPFPGKSKRPDYSLTIEGIGYLFDVKDFEYYQLPSSGLFGGEGKIRNRIEEAREKFKEYKEWPCSLVLYNNGAPLLGLTWPHTVLGAMYGNVGIGWDVDIRRGESVPNSERQVFLSGGKMIHPHTGQAQNTTISALISLRYTTKTKSGERALGVIVWENVLARVPFSAELFRGPFDERYGLKGESIEQVFAGDELLGAG